MTTFSEKCKNISSDTTYEIISGEMRDILYHSTGSYTEILSIQTSDRSLINLKFFELSIQIGLDGSSTR